MVAVAEWSQQRKQRAKASQRGLPLLSLPAWMHSKGPRGGRGGSKSGRGGGSDSFVYRSSASLGGLPTAPSLVRSRVEPKTFFAAERTFLSWINIAVLVRSGSLIM